jgi:hypothetical protein
MVARCPARLRGREVNIVHDQENVEMGFVRRRARRRTALVVGGAAYAAGRHRGRGQGYEQGYDEGYDEGGQYEQAPPGPPPQAAPAEPSQGIDYAELQQLGELHANGTLTDEEFAAAKARILGT